MIVENKVSVGFDKWQWAIWNRKYDTVDTIYNICRIKIIPPYSTDIKDEFMQN